MKSKILKFGIISLVTMSLILSIIFLCYQKFWSVKEESLVTIEPIQPPVFIPDGFDAKIFDNHPYEIKTFNEGGEGYEKVVEAIKNNLSRKDLAVNLNCLSAFYAGYDLLFYHEKCDEILNILNDLLNSSNLDDVQAAVTEIYYDFDISSNNKTKHIVESLEKLRTTSKDEYTVRFATLSLNKMYAGPGVRKDTYQVRSIWGPYKQSTEK
jgi:hypothetical protein